MKLWLASFPRSGNTLFRNVLYYCYGMESSVFHYGVHYPQDQNYLNYDVVKTHMLPQEVKEINCPVVYLIRDGRDALVSMAHQKKDLIQKDSSFEENLHEAIIAAEGSFFGGWSKNVNEWMDRADVVIRYEDLVADPVGQVERLRKFMDLPAPDISKLPTFEQMKQGEAYFGKKELDGFQVGERNKRAEKFFRKGKSGSWREEMPEHLHDLFWNYHGETMERLGYLYSGERTELDDFYDSHWKQKIEPYTPLPVLKKKVLVEADKVMLPSRDGVKRYVVELLHAFKELRKDIKEGWQIDVQVLDKIYSINKYEALTVDLELQPPKELYTYEKILLGVRHVIKTVTPVPVYEKLAPIYRKRFRKNVLAYKNQVALGHISNEVKFAAQQSETKEKQPAYDLMHIPLPQNFGHINKEVHRFIFTVHDLSHKLFPQFHQDNNVQLAESGMSFIKTNSTSVIAISQATKTDLEKLYGLPADKIPVIPEAVDRGKFKYNVNRHYADLVRNKYNIHEKDFFLTVSTLEPRKNLETLIKAFSKLCDELPQRDFVLVIVGKKGWKYDSIIKHQSKYHQRILFTGFVPDTELAALYSDAVSFSYLSHYEGFGLPVLEAMSCRAPVIVADNSSLPELVQDAAVLVQAADVETITRALKELLVDKNFREHKAIQAWRRSFDFSWRKTAIQTLKAYQVAIDAQ